MINNLLSVSQSGFVLKDSTTFQLLVIYDDFCKALDKKQTTQSIFFDISKAFDRVWHLGLIRKLHAIGICGNILGWFKSYLSGRSQAVVVKGETSNYLPLRAGVPQGSVLGPLLFIIYITDLTSNTQSTIKIFDDETSTYMSLEDVHQITDILNLDLAKVTDWAKTWTVKFNPLKTELMTISSKHTPTILSLL